MPEKNRSPLVLIVDDDKEFREDIGPEFITKQLGSRVIKAEDVESGLRQLAEHDPHSADPVDLLIIDMHMPLSDDEIKISDEAGILCLRYAKRFNLDPPIVIVFTAHPSYDDCVRAAKDGADAYVLKLGEAGKEEPLVVLETVCKQYLAQTIEKQAPVPSADWLGEHYGWLCGAFGGRWVALIEKDDAAKAGYDVSSENRVQAGLFIIVGDSYSEVRDQIIAESALWKAEPAIALLPKLDK
jgi:CheY-like chemotaxis protein